MTLTTSSILKKLLVLFLVVAGLYYAKEFLMPLSIGAVLATLFLPFCKWLEEKKVPRGVAAFICLFVLLLVITSIGALLGWQVAELTNDITLIKQRSVEAAHSIQHYILLHFGITVAEQSQLMKDQQSSVSSIVQMVAGSMSYVFKSFVLVLVYVFLLLCYRLHIKKIHP